MNKNAIDVEHLSEVDKSESVPALEPAGSACSVPPSHEHGWPQASPPPATFRDWESAQPVIPRFQLKVGTIPPLSSDQQRCIDQQLRSNSQEVDKP